MWRFLYVLVPMSLSTPMYLLLFASITAPQSSVSSLCLPIYPSICLSFFLSIFSINSSYPSIFLAIQFLCLYLPSHCFPVLSPSCSLSQLLSLSHTQKLQLPPLSLSKSCNFFYFSHQKLWFPLSLSLHQKLQFILSHSLLKLEFAHSLSLLSFLPIFLPLLKDFVLFLSKLLSFA